MQTLVNILSYLLNVAVWLILAHFVMSWLLVFNVLNARQEFVQRVWKGLSQLLEPVYRPVRRLLPPLAGLDLAPLVVLILIQVLRIALDTNRASF